MKLIKKIRLAWNNGMMNGYVINLEKALDSDNLQRMNYYANQAIKAGKKSLELSEKLTGKPNEELKGIVERIELIYEEMKESQRNNSFKNSLEQSYSALENKFDVIGTEKSSFLAGRMVDMYRIAADRLDTSPKLLTIIYLENPDAPQELKDVIKLYLDKKILKNEAVKQLEALKQKTQNYLKEIGADASKKEMPIVILNKTFGLEGKVKTDD